MTANMLDSVDRSINSSIGESLTFIDQVLHILERVIIELSTGTLKGVNKKSQTVKVSWSIGYFIFSSFQAIVVVAG